MNDPSITHLVGAALTGILLGGMMALVWGHMAVLMWQDRAGRRQLLIAVALIPLFVAAAQALHINHGLSSSALSTLQPRIPKGPTVLERALANIAAAGFGTFLTALFLLLLLLPGFGLQAAVHTLVRFLLRSRSERLFTPRRLKALAAWYFACVFLLVATDGYMAAYHALLPSYIAQLARDSVLFTLLTHVALAVAPPVVLWKLAEHADRILHVDAAEARRLLTDYAAVLENRGFASRSPSELPASKDRLKKAFKVMVPIALAEGDVDYLRSMGLAYGLLACFGGTIESQLAEGLRLQVEWSALLGGSSSISEAADGARTVVDQMAIADSAPLREQAMRQIASAELLASRYSKRPELE